LLLVWRIEHGNGDPILPFADGLTDSNLQGFTLLARTGPAHRAALALSRSVRLVDLETSSKSMTPSARTGSAFLSNANLLNETFRENPT